MRITSPVPTHIRSDAKDPEKRADEIERTRHQITERVKPHIDLNILNIRPAAVSLSAREFPKMSSSYDGGPSAQLYVLGALKQESSVFAMTKQIYRALSPATLADGSRVILGNTALGLDDPERFRPRLLGLMSKSAADTTKSLGALGPAEFEGLEHPGAVMQLS